MSAPVAFLAAWITTSAVMAGLWWWQRQRGRASLVDVAWTLGVGGWGLCFALFAAAGLPARRAVVAALVGIWSLRLAGHIARRIGSEPEDGRYRALLQQWGAGAQRRLFWFFQFQALGCLLFAVPLWLAAHNPAPWGIADAAGLVVGLLALCGEAAADRQLSRFRGDSKNAKQVCRVGWWRYSRHPNYFFEWLHWWAYVALAATAPGGWLALIGPLAMLYFILRVTGIPPTEAQALRSRGEAYRDYQRTTSPFFPWPPRTGEKSP